ncbi:hypothetical protein EVAR_66127_1 [Eumeta japonica]|uniref:Uncharacterized protein n=1 Tax=Eumeta variegata TaxID=151549 RepID=A0A4C1ZV65_EUMVA|nr:hypothetical protein EVAR_66127_1 [Eumeta japonica]
MAGGAEWIGLARRADTSDETARHLARTPRAPADNSFWRRLCGRGRNFLSSRDRSARHKILCKETSHRSTDEAGGALNLIMVILFSTMRFKKVDLDLRSRKINVATVRRLRTSDRTLSHQSRSTAMGDDPVPGRDDGSRCKASSCSTRRLQEIPIGKYISLLVTAFLYTVAACVVGIKERAVRRK